MNNASTTSTESAYRCRICDQLTEIAIFIGPFCARCGPNQQGFVSQLVQSMKSLTSAQAEVAALKAEVERLRAAIATPEVYAGVVSEVVEKERDEAVVRLTATEAENAVLKAEVERLERHRRQAQDRADSCEYAHEVDGLLREIQGRAMQEAEYQKERAKKAEAAEQAKGGET